MGVAAHGFVGKGLQKNGDSAWGAILFITLSCHGRHLSAGRIASQQF
jgi:hypothetical protein